jgi:DNA polymerase III beta subunit
VQFTISRHDLYQILQKAQSIIPKNDLQPGIGQHVKLEVQNNRISLTAFGEGLYLHTHVDDCVQVQTAGSICVKFSRLFNIVKVLGSDICNISVQDVIAGPLIIQNGYTDVTIDECRSAQEFPPPQNLNPELEIILSGLDFKRLITESAFSIGSRQGLNGIHVDVNQDDSSLRFVSTDGNRMSWSAAQMINLSTDQESHVELNQKLLSMSSVMEMKKICVEEVDCSLGFGDHAFIFKTENAFLQGSILGGNFPRYQQTLHNLYKKVPNKALLDRKKTNAICDRVRTIATEKDKASLNMEFNDQEVIFSMHQNGKQIFQDHLPIDFEGESVKIAFKCQYFQDVLKSLESDLIVLNLGRGENDACILRVPERADCEYIIMPMKTS